MKVSLPDLLYMVLTKAAQTEAHTVSTTIGEAWPYFAAILLREVDCVSSLEVKCLHRKTSEFY
jgi:hypothetical protein